MGSNLNVSASVTLKNKNLQELLARIAADYPDLEFIESAHFAWHAGHGRVSYVARGKDPHKSMWGLLHELGHALLKHTDYTYDAELVQLEVRAWQRARELAGHYGVSVDEEYIQDCVDTYRDWLHLRSTCPGCFSRSLQDTSRSYHCHNCGSRWQVSRSRLCRPYRLQK